MASSGTSDDVLLAYVQNSQSTFNLSADNVLYLKDVGVSSQVITAMLNRDAALRNQTPTYNYEQRAYAPTAPPPAEPAPVPAPAPVAEPAPTTPPAAPAPTYVSSPPAEVSSFYSDLSPYGTWVDLPDYGWCWQPTVVVINHSWRPYCDSGHWVWTDQGWFWVSDYSWGWAPFHYGRWYLHAGCGWVWMPDRVWGPAWVVWRSGGDHCGWAPLPPHADFDVRLGWRFNGVRVGMDFDFGLHMDCFTFVAFGDFCDHDLGHRCLPPTQVTRIYNHTTIINNYTVVNNTTIVNRGFGVERVAAATHREIRPAVIRDLPASGNRTIGSDKGGLVVYRPQLQAHARPVKMVAQKIDVQHPVIQHTEMRSVVAARNDQRVAPRSNVPAWGATAHGNQGVTPSTPGKTAQLPAHLPSSRAVEPPSAPQNQAPKRSTDSAVNSHPATPAHPAATAPSAPTYSRTVEEPKPASHTTTSYSAPAATPSTSARNFEESKPAPRTTTAVRDESQPRAVRSASQTQLAGKGTSQEQNPHVYYPKTAHQAAEIHSLPPSNPRPVNGGGSSERNPGAQSKNNN